MFDNVVAPTQQQDSQVSTETPKKKASASTMLSSGIRLHKAITRLRVSLSTLERTAQDFADLRAIRTEMTSFGITPNLIRPVNYSGNLTKMLPSMPAVERMDESGIRAGDRRLKACSEEIDTMLNSEPAHVADYVHESVDHLEDLFKHLRTQAESIDETSDELLEDLHRMKPAAEVFAEVTMDVMCCEPLRKMIEALQHVALHMDHPAKDKMSDMHELVGLLTASTGIHVSPEGHVVLDHNNVEAEYECSEKTLAEHGYDTEKLIALLHAVNTLVDSLVELCGKHDEMAEGFHKEVHAYAPSTEGESGDTLQGSHIAGSQPETDMSQEAAAAEGAAAAPEGEPAPAAEPATEGAQPTGEGSGDQSGAPANEDTNDMGDPLAPGNNKDEFHEDLGSEESYQGLQECRSCVSGYIALVICVVECSVNAATEVLEIAEDVVDEAEEDEEEEKPAGGTEGTDAEGAADPATPPAPAAEGDAGGAAASAEPPATPEPPAAAATPEAPAGGEGGEPAAAAAAPAEPTPEQTAEPVAEPDPAAAAAAAEPPAGGEGVTSSAEEDDKDKPKKKEQPEEDDDGGSDFNIMMD